MEENETVEDGLIREVWEELNCKLADYQLFSKVSISGWNEEETYHFVYFLGKLEGEVKVSSEIESFIGVNKTDIKNNVVALHSHVVKTKILEDLITKGIIN